MAQEQKAEKSAKSNGGKKWSKVERKRVHYYKPGGPEECTPVVGMVKAKEQRNGRFGTKTVYTIVATEDGFDAKGPWKRGDKVLVREYATLRDLDELMGAEVRLTPAAEERKLDNGNRVRDFDVEV